MVEDQNFHKVKKIIYVLILFFVFASKSYSQNFKLEKLVNLFGNVNYTNQHVNRLSKSKARNLVNESKFMNFSIYKIINIGISLSIFSHQIGTFFEKLIEKLFNNFFNWFIYRPYIFYMCV